MTYIGFKYIHVLFILLVLILLTVNFESTTYGALQKWQAPSKEPPPPPKEPSPPPKTSNQDLCNGCIDKCCADFKECAKGPNPEQCEGKNKNCVNNCKLGDCKDLGYNRECKIEIVTEIPKTPNQDLCNGCIDKCCAAYLNCMNAPNSNSTLSRYIKNM